MADFPAKPLVASLYAGQKVKILYPSYAEQLTGVVLLPEEDSNRVKTGYWLVKVEHLNMVLALTPKDVEALPR